MDFVEQHTAEKLADARDGLPQRQSVGVMRRGGGAAGAFAVATPLIVGADARQSTVDTLVSRRIGKAVGDAVAIGLLGNLFAKGWEVVLAGGMLHVGQELGPLVRQMPAAAAPVAGGAPLGGGDGGLPEHAAAQQPRNFGGVDRVMLGLPPGDGFHGQRMPEDKWHALPCPQVCQPGPSQQAFGSQDDLSAVGGHGLETCLWGSGHVAVQQRFTSLGKEAHIHAAGVESKTTVTRGLCRVESP